MTKRWEPPSQRMTVEIRKDLLKLDWETRKRRVCFLALHWPPLYSELMCKHREELGFPHGLAGPQRAPRPATSCLQSVFLGGGT